MAGPNDLTPRLSRAFFARPVLQVAPELLGCTITHTGVTVRLTEVEAYDGSNDPGSHAYRGRTARTLVMFGQPGGLYVYFSYGMHWCANLVCGPVGAASAVLLRAGEVVAGLPVARTRRSGAGERDLARGPARLAAALGLTGEQNGTDTAAAGSPVVVAAAKAGSRCAPVPGSQAGVVATGPRVGVRGPGGDGAAYPWRFWLVGEGSVSAYRPAVVRRSNPPAGPPGR
jgi:DNA-3-methyladenine glycosylase